MKYKRFFGGVMFLGIMVLFFVLSTIFFNSTPIEYLSSGIESFEEKKEEEGIEVFVATHLDTPEPLKAIYMTSWVASTRGWRAEMVKLIEETELNSIIIDIKDYSGAISFIVSDPLLVEIGAAENRISDIREFIQLLHDKNIYVIGRITVFQDPFLAGKRPELAIKKDSDRNIIWTDHKGLSYVDPGAREVWDYIVALARESYNIGFDELNFDYIRFPSDGNMRDIYFPFSEETVNADPDLGKAKVIKKFFAYLDGELSDTDAILSADLFGMTTTNTDDLNIGQILEDADLYFDYIAPMVYPSHYPKGFNGYQNVNKYPYEIVKYSMDKGVERLLAASSSPLKLRPWLQDFDYPVTYTADMVRAQIQAVYDAGLTSWMLWDSANRYTREALDNSE